MNQIAHAIGLSHMSDRCRAAGIDVDADARNATPAGDASHIEAVGAADVQKTIEGCFDRCEVVLNFSFVGADVFRQKLR